MRRILVLLIRFYKKFFSYTLELVFGKACRFQPTCSLYAAQAIEKYGIFKGSFLSFKRLINCHPLSVARYDPLP